MTHKVSITKESTTELIRTYAESGELEPKDESGLEGEVPREIVQNGAEGETLEEVEETENDPVRKPLNVILVARGLECLEGQVGRECPTNEVGNGGGKGVEEVEKGDKEDDANKGVRLGDLRALLKVDENRVLREL